MNKYELTVVVNAKIEDDERAQVIEKVKDLVTRFGGNVTDVDEWGKRRLAYEIQKMKEAYYYFIHFESDATVPGEVEERIRIMDNVLRYFELWVAGISRNRCEYSALLFGYFQFTHSSK